MSAKSGIPRKPLRARHATAILFAVGLFCLVGPLHADERQTELKQGPPRLASESLLRPSTAKSLSWNKEEKALVWSYVALNAIDAYQTLNIPEGNAEGNPLLSSWAGSRPDAAEVLLFKSATTYGLLHLTKRFTKTRKSRKWALWLMNSIQLSVDIQNERVTGGIVF